MKCKYCGHEYSKEIIRFCPKCGKNLMDNVDSNEARHITVDNVIEEKCDNTNKEIAVTVADAQANDSNVELSFKDKFDRKFAKVAANICLFLIGIGILFWGIEAATGFPIKDRVLGVDNNIGRPLYKKAVKRVKEGLLPFDVTVSDYKKRNVWHGGVKTEKFDAGDLRLDTYIITVPITIHFKSGRSRDVDIKIAIWEFDDDDNSVEVYSKFGDFLNTFKDGFKVFKLWETEIPFGNTNVEGYRKELLDSWENLMILIFDELQRDYEDNDGGDYYFDTYFEEYFIPLVNFDSLSKSEENSFKLFCDCVELNMDSLKNKYPYLL